MLAMVGLQAPQRIEMPGWLRLLARALAANRPSEVLNEKRPFAHSGFAEPHWHTVVPFPCFARVEKSCRKWDGSCIRGAVCLGHMPSYIA
jgi:hypothetical protein